MSNAIVAEIIRQWLGQHCWLDGEPAKIIGGRNKFATVATTDGRQAVEFNWHTVNNIMRRSKEFKCS